MTRTVTVLFRRVPTRDRRENEVKFEGYELFWPDGDPVTIGLEALCKYGQRLLGLGRHMEGCDERLLNLVVYPLRSRDENLTRIPGRRVRRFCLQREGREGRVHFIDGSPTAVVFDLVRDEPRVVHWIGLTSLRDGEYQWFDLAAEPALVPDVVVSA